MGETAGAFHCLRTVRGFPKGVRTWRVTTNDRDVAAAASTILGGTPVECPDGGWEVLTDATTVRVLVEGAGEKILAFRLLGNCGLGVFEFRSDPWALREALGDATARLPVRGGAVLCELGIGAMSVTTELGMHIEYVRPSLRVVASRSGTHGGVKI